MATPPEQGKSLLVDTLPATATTPSAPKYPVRPHHRDQCSDADQEIPRKPNQKGRRNCPWRRVGALPPLGADDMGSFIVEDDERELLLGKSTVEGLFTLISEQLERNEQHLRVIEADLRRLQKT